jgi:uncharacterized protein (DUF433 family)
VQSADRHGTALGGGAIGRDRRIAADRIAIDPAVHNGDPCIKRTREPVSIISGSIMDDDTLADADL